jgi:hypothetical protein
VSSSMAGVYGFPGEATARRWYDQRGDGTDDDRDRNCCRVDRVLRAACQRTDDALLSAQPASFLPPRCRKRRSPLKHKEDIPTFDSYFAEAFLAFRIQPRCNSTNATAREQRRVV